MRALGLIALLCASCVGAPPRACVASGPYARSCPCEDGGAALTVACRGTECFAYGSTCIDEGFEPCTASATGALLSACNDFCNLHGAEDWAGGCAALP